MSAGHPRNDNGLGEIVDPKVGAPTQLQAGSKSSKIPVASDNNAHSSNDDGLDEIMDSKDGGPNPTSS